MIDRDDLTDREREVYDAAHSDGFTQGRALGQREGRDAALLAAVMGVKPKETCPTVDGETRHLHIMGQLACRCGAQKLLADGRIIVTNVP